MEFGEISSTERRGQWNDFKSISTVKMETRHPVEVNLGSEFPAICNHCGVMAACSRKTWKNFWEIFCVFWKNDPSGYNFLKFCSGRFYLETDRRVVFKFREIWPTGNRWNRALFIWQKQKKIACLSNCRYCADRAQNLPGQAPTVYSECSRFHPSRFIFRRSYSQTREHCQNAPWSESNIRLMPSFGPNK